MASEADVELSFEDLTFGGPDETKNATQADKPQEPETQDNEHVVLISSPYGSKIVLQWNLITKRVEEICGPIKQENFREKQTFGFVQFFNHESVAKAVEKLQDYEIEGCTVSVEVCEKITPGRDPRTHDSNSEFKNSTLVLKNLPFQLKQDKLEELLNQYEWKPQNVSYLYDGSGMFRGMAFVKYKEIEQAQKVFETMNNLDINGRKLRIEYKRKAKEAETPQDDDNKKIYDQLVNFNSNPSLNELAFPCSSSFQRKQLHHFAEKLGLGHYSTGEGESKFVIVKKKDESSQLSTSAPKSGQPINRNRKGSDAKKGSYDPKAEDGDGKYGSYERSGAKSTPRSFGSGSGYGVKSPPSSFGNNFVRSPPNSYSGSFGSSHIKSPSSYGNSHLKSPSSSLGTSPTFRKINRPPTDAPIVSPSRQPKGPDGTNGFSSEYRDLRSKSTTTAV